MIFSRKIALASAAALAWAGAAQATVFDVVTGFGSSPWSYGGGAVGAGFVASPNYGTTEAACGNAGLACYYSAGNDYGFPMIAKNTSGATITYATNVIAIDELFMQSLVGNQAIVRFTAPTAGYYRFAGAFERLDNMNGAGDGTNVGASGIFSAALQQTFHSSATIDFGQNLALGETIDFFVDSGSGSTFNDGTGLRLSASVPEPTSWAMMVGGFGLIGGALRRRRTIVRFA